MIIIVSGAACGGTVQGAPASELLACTERPIRSYPIGRPVSAALCWPCSKLQDGEIELNRFLIIYRYSGKRLCPIL